MTLSKSILLVAVLLLVRIGITSVGYAGPVRAPVVDEVDEDAAAKPFVVMEGMTKTCSLTCGNETISCTTGKDGITTCSTNSMGNTIICAGDSGGQVCSCSGSGWDCDTL